MLLFTIIAALRIIGIVSTAYSFILVFVPTVYRFMDIVPDTHLCHGLVFDARLLIGIACDTLLRRQIGACADIQTQTGVPYS